MKDLRGVAVPLTKAAEGTGPPDRANISKRRRKISGELKYLNEDELRMLFRAIADSGSPDTVRDIAIFEVAYHRGLRASEVGALQVGDLRSDLKRLYVRRKKGSHSGEYLLTDRETKALRAWMRKRRELLDRRRDPGALFLSRNMRAISRRRLDELMKRYGAIAGIPESKRHMHALKHSCATSLSERGVPVEEIQDHVGHADIRSTMIYTKITSRRRQRRGEELQRDW